MKSYTDAAVSAQTNSVLSAMSLAVVFVGALIAPESAMAFDTGAGDRVNGFFNSINKLLNVASIAVVTIAVIFAGYQIAFAHKRMADVAPVLIGGFLIGAAAQIAKMLMGESTLETALLINALPIGYA